MAKGSEEKFTAAEFKVTTEEAGPDVKQNFSEIGKELGEMKKRRSHRLLRRMSTRTVGTWWLV